MEELRNGIWYIEKNIQQNDRSKIPLISNYIKQIKLSNQKAENGRMG